MLFNLLILVGISLWLWCIYSIFRAKGELGEKFLVAVISILGFSLYNVILIGIFSIIIMASPNITKVQYQNIVSLNNNSEVQGSFILGSGTISETEYYFYFVKQDDGGLYRDKVKTRNVVIYETDKVTPRCEWTKVINKPVPSWILKREIFDVLSSDCYKLKDFKFYVPTNTIIKEFKLR